MESLIKLLSAGVIAAVITGGFSLIIALSNNRRLIKLEKEKQKFTLNQERYKELRNAYDELLSNLPSEKLTGTIFKNLPTFHELQEKETKLAIEKAKQNMQIIYTHYQKYCFLFSTKEQKQIIKQLDELENINKELINLTSDNPYIPSSGNRYEYINLNNTFLINTVVKLENLYYKIFKDNLNELSK